MQLTACNAAAEAGISGTLTGLHSETPRAVALFSFLFLHSVVVLALASSGDVFLVFFFNLINAALPPPVPLVFLFFAHHRSRNEKQFHAFCTHCQRSITPVSPAEVGQMVQWLQHEFRPAIICCHRQSTY